jgi:hypothetical protein
MKISFLKTICISSALMVSMPAFASHTVILPNGLEVPYFGQSTPTFTVARTPSGQSVFKASDQAGQVVYYYSASGTWVGATGSGTGSLTLPTVPTTVTLPNGSVVPYTGQGVPDISFADAQGNFYVIDPVSSRASIYSPSGQPIGGGSVSDSDFSLSSSSSFGGHTDASSSFGTPTSSGAGSSGVLPSSSGSTSVPAPPAFALFGLGAGALVLRRFRSRKKLPG